MKGRAPSGRGLAALALCAALPACVAMAHAANVADAAHDEAVVRALGLGWTGAWRALDAAWAGAAMALPLGTRALRAALASALACAVGAGLLHGIARTLLRRASGEAVAGSGWLGTAIAAIATLTCVLAPAWQMEAQAAGGSVLGAALTLAPVAILPAADALAEARVVAVAFALGIALSYEPLVFASSALACGAAVALADGDARRALFAPGGWRAAAPCAAAFVVGLVPFALAALRHAARVPVLATPAGLFAGAAGESGESGGGLLVAMLRDELGVVTTVVALAGAALALLAPRARSAGAALLALAVMGPVSMAFGAPCGPTRYGPVVLAALAALAALAGVAMQGVVLAVARAKVPFAVGSAAMIVVLEATFPARAADDTATREGQRPENAASAWSDAAWGPLPAGAVVLVRDPRVELRLLAARASGELRGDLSFVPLFDLGGRVALRALAREGKLQPIWRDAVLLGAEGEWSLSQLAASRPLVAPYDRAWDAALARHLVPAGLFARFEPEPRGASDRRRALDDFAPVRERLARAIDGDPELVALTTTLLRARAVALAATAERDLVARALDDLRPFAPRDPVALELVKRAAAKPHGPIDVNGLAP